MMASGFHRLRMSILFRTGVECGTLKIVHFYLFTHFLIT